MGPTAAVACALVAISPVLGSYDMIATYQPETDILSASKIDLDLEEIVTDLTANDFAAAMGVYESGTNSDQTLQSISQPGGPSGTGTNAMQSNTWWPIYKAYWGVQINYADVFVQKYGAAGAAYQDATRAQLVKKGIAYQGVWMYAVHKFETAIADCLKGTVADVNSAKLNWDKGMAYYVGSQEGTTTGASTGNLLYNLAQKRCADFGTCATTTDSSTIATANKEAIAKATEGMAYFVHTQLSCADPQLGKLFDGIVSQMTVPLVQGMLKYAWKADPANAGDCSADAGKAEAAVSSGCAQSWAEGWAFAAAVLPQVHKCDASAATKIKENLDIESTAGPMTGGVKAVKDAIESVYDCLGISCTDVGEYQAGGTVFDGMKKCTFAPSTDEGSTATGSNPSPMATDSAVSRAGAALAGAVAAAAFLA
jgi:hypothetical protein